MTPVFEMPRTNPSRGATCNPRSSTFRVGTLSPVRAYPDIKNDETNLTSQWELWVD